MSRDLKDLDEKYRAKAELIVGKEENTWTVEETRIVDTIICVGDALWAQQYIGTEADEYGEWTRKFEKDMKDLDALLKE
jgi:hypothetical protein